MLLVLSSRWMLLVLNWMLSVLNSRSINIISKFKVNALGYLLMLMLLVVPWLASPIQTREIWIWILVIFFKVTCSRRMFLALPRLYILSLIHIGGVWIWAPDCRTFIQNGASGRAEEFPGNFFITDPGQGAWIWAPDLLHLLSRTGHLDVLLQKHETNKQHTKTKQKKTFCLYSYDGKL